MPYKILRLLLLFVTLLLTSNSEGLAQTLVVADSVKRIEFNDQITLVSRTKTVRSSEIVATISGQVAQVSAEEGVWVARGTPLVRIAPERLQLALNAKQAEAKQAKAQAAEAARAFQRSQGLYLKELIPESNIDSDSSLAIAARERYQQLLAEEERLAFDVAQCTIRAPFGGYTGRQLVDVGEWVGPGTPVFELIDPSVIKVTVDLPERYFGQLSSGSPVVIALSNDDRPPRIGYVTGISPNASEATHTFPVFVTVKNKDGYLGGGMLVRATLSLNNKFSSLAVSKDAIVRQGLQTVVYTVTDGQAALIPVVTSSSVGEMIAVQGDGLKEGMRVIVRGNERIFPGSPVTVSGQPAAGNHSN